MPLIEDTEKHAPLVSIITIVYNGEKYIEQCLKSIRNQTYHNIEYIVIDGKSKDNTLAILDNHKDLIDVMVSEKDRGISDAFNKGVARATGDIIGILNSDDYFNDDTLQDVVNFYIDNDKKNGIYYGNIRYFNDDTSYTRISDLSRIWKYMSLNHPSMFVTKDVYEKIGGFSETLKYVMDAEFIHRALKNKISFFYIDKSLSNFRLEGASDVNYKAMNKEFYQSVRKYNNQGMVTEFWYLWSLLKRNIAQTQLGRFFYKRKHLIAPLLAGKIKKA